MDSNRTPRTTPRDFFLYLGTLITLYFSVGSLIALLFSVINRYLPDALDYAYTVGVYSSGIRFALAVLLVIFPTYLLLSWMIGRDTEIHPENKLLGLRRWLTYLHLFVAGAVILGTLVTLINYFLSGEITTRFLLKIAAIVVIAGGVFSYYIADLRSDEGYLKRFKLFAIISSILVVVSIISGFLVIGLPQNQRGQQLDQRRVNDLQSIQWEITNYYQVKQTLPPSLAELNDGLGNFIVPTDPETKQPYTYTKTATTTFNLCADFKTVSTETQSQAYEVTGNWQHGIGTVCFDRTIDPERYPPIKR